jgi:hypothetical protein
LLDDPRTGDTSADDDGGDPEVPEVPERDLSVEHLKIPPKALKEFSGAVSYLSGFVLFLWVVVRWIFRHIILNWQMWSAVATVAVALFAVIQWRETRIATDAAVRAAGSAELANKQAEQANKDARERFQREERPYVWLTSSGIGAPKFVPEPGGKIPDSGQVIWTWHFTNYGKTPAYKLRVQQYMSFDGGQFVPSHHEGPKEPYADVPIPPGQDLLNSVVSEPGITNQQWTQAIGLTGKGVSIRAVVQYGDSYDAQYESVMCLRLLNSGAVSYCPGSYIK